MICRPTDVFSYINKTRWISKLTLAFRILSLLLIVLGALHCGFAIKALASIKSFNLFFRHHISNVGPSIGLHRCSFWNVGPTFGSQMTNCQDRITLAVKQCVSLFVGVDGHGQISTNHVKNVFANICFCHSISIYIWIVFEKDQSG